MCEAVCMGIYVCEAICMGGFCVQGSVCVRLFVWGICMCRDARGSLQRGLCETVGACL